MDTLFALLELLRNELLLFAAIGLLIGGLDDLSLDLIHALRWLWRRCAIYSRFPRMTARDLPPPGAAGPIAVFIPAWDESAVIQPMLTRCLDLWRDEDVHFFIGCYPNDQATIDKVVEVTARAGTASLSIIVNPTPGPTTKADCLNQLWQAMRQAEAASGQEVLVVVLHDAEDVIHGDALRLIGFLAPRFALVQLPVLPLVSTRSRWVSGHYCDEFAAAHGQSLLVRECLGAAMPSAGVGCGFNRAALGRIAAMREDQPFDAESLTEDYELGLLIGDHGGRGVFVRMRDEAGDLIATREYFPDTFSAAVRQKARWTVGIALAGWDRLGWRGDWRESWMRLRDRRAVLAALVLLAAYLSLVLTPCLWLAETAGLLDPRSWSPLLVGLLWLNGAFLIWRLVVRLVFVWRAYGPVEALRSIPRTFVANIIAMAAARRAMVLYVQHLRGARLAWDKTAHRFPDGAEERA